MILSKEDARSIRKGSGFTFHANRDGVELRIKENWCGNFDDSQVILSDSNRKYDGRIFFSGHDENSGWGALKALVRAGDELKWDWSDNCNGYVKAAEIRPERWEQTDQSDGAGHPYYAGLHADTLYVTIVRNGKAIVRTLHVDQSICPDNTARAIRKGAS